MTNAVCTFTGKVTTIRVVGAGQAVLLQPRVFADGNVTAVSFTGALDNAKFEKIEGKLNPINASEPCDAFDATYSVSGSKIQVRIPKGGQPGLFLGILPNGRDCTRGCAVEWQAQAEKSLDITVNDSAAAPLAGPLPESDVGTCSLEKGGSAPDLGLRNVFFSSAEQGTWRCGEKEKESTTVEGDWVLHAGPSKSLRVVSLDVRGTSLEATVESETAPLPQYLRIRQDRKPLLAVPLPPDVPWSPITILVVIVGFFVSAGLLGFVFVKRRSTPIPTPVQPPPPPMVPPSRPLFDILLYVDNDAVFAKASANGPWTDANELGKDGSLEKVEEFGRLVDKHGKYDREPDSELLDRAHDLHAALFKGDLAKLFYRTKPTIGPMVVRFFLDDPRLQKVPWEALCEGRSSVDFLASRTDVFAVRGVSSTVAVKSRPIPQSPLVLLIAPQGESAEAMQKNLESKGARVEALSGRDVTWDRLCTRLQSGTVPDVIHFLGHGSVQDDHAKLRLADLENEDPPTNEVWIKAEHFAQQVQACIPDLPLVVLEACQGAVGGVLGSAAEQLVRRGVDTVVSFSSLVRSGFSWETSTAFYEALLRGNQTRFDVVASACAARRQLLGKNACGFSIWVHVRAKLES